MAFISASLLAADFARLGAGLEAIERAGAKMVHIDVCDGHFSPGITAGLPVVERVRRATRLVLDVHLIVERPERFVSEYLDAGADRIALHPDSTTELLLALRRIRSRRAQAGTALSAAMPIGAVSEVVEELDFLTIVETGEATFNFRRASRKLAQAIQLRRERGLRFLIQVEGDINEQQAAEFGGSGARVIVATPGPERSGTLKDRIERLVRAASQADDHAAVAQGVITGSESL